MSTSSNAFERLVSTLQPVTATTSGRTASQHLGRCDDAPKLSKGGLLIRLVGDFSCWTLHLEVQCPSTQSYVCPTIPCCLSFTAVERASKIRMSQRYVALINATCQLINATCQLINATCELINATCELNINWVILINWHVGLINWHIALINWHVALIKSHVALINWHVASRTASMAGVGSI